MYKIETNFVVYCLPFFLPVRMPETGVINRGATGTVLNMLIFKKSVADKLPLILNILLKSRH